MPAPEASKKEIVNPRRKKPEQAPQRPRYNPVSEAGLDDAVDPAVALANQGYKHAKSAQQQKAMDKYIADRLANQGRQVQTPPSMQTGPVIKAPTGGKAPMPLNLARLGVGTAAGIVAESTTQQMMNATRGGEKSNNPYIKNLEKLGSRMVGGATTGAIYGGKPGAIAGAAGGAAVDIADNAIEAAKMVPQAAQLFRDKNESGFVQQRSEAAAREKAKSFDQRMRDSIQRNLPKRSPVVRRVQKLQGVSFTNKPVPVS